MAPAMREASKEYWRPANLQIERVIRPLTAHSVCSGCKTEYPIGARFCHVCGEEREKQLASHTTVGFSQLFDMELIRQRLGLSVPSLVFFLIGMTCLCGAVLTGFVYRASTVLDWQAVQAWRIEWLLAAIGTLLAGILLKKRSA